MNRQVLLRSVAYGAIALLVAIASLWLQHRPALPPQGEMVILQDVLSGQTLKVQWQGETLTIRLAGLDVPDRAQVPWGPAAEQALRAQLPPGQAARFAPSLPERDRYDRQWGYLWYGDTLMNQWLLQQGYAIARQDPHSPFATTLSHAQDYARIKGAGLWSPETPLRQTPSEFRTQTAADPSSPTAP